MASFRPASVLSASVYLLQWGLPSDRFRLFMPTSVGAANEQQGVLYWRLDQQCASPMQVHQETALPVVAYPSFSLWIICIYAVMPS